MDINEPHPPEEELGNDKETETAESLTTDSVAVTVSEDEKNQEDENAIDRLTDVFRRMVKGIFLFTLKTIPLFIWNHIKDFEWVKRYLKNVKKILRLVMWGTIWLVLVFIAWAALGWEVFASVWTWVGLALWSLCVDVFRFGRQYIGIIWAIVALIGSGYGLYKFSRKGKNDKHENIPQGSLGETSFNEAQEPSNECSSEVEDVASEDDHETNDKGQEVM